jgi:hypothetical protein
VVEDSGMKGERKQHSKKHSGKSMYLRSKLSENSKRNMVMMAGL